MTPTPIPALLRRTASLFAALFLAFGICIVTPSLHAEETKHEFDIPAGEARPMLRLFSSQAKQEIVFYSKAVEGFRTNAVKGHFTSKEALNQMLMDSGLVAASDKSGAIAVRRETDAEKNVARATAQPSDRPIEMERVEVKDSRIDGLINKGLLQAGPDAPLYHSVVTRADIERLGATSMEELFRYLPQTTTGVTSSQSIVSDFGSGARFPTTSLRGFSASQTVILINGRALPRTSPTVGGGADIDRIPIAAIERVEILPYAGSAIYGAGAIGGAINIILRKDYSGRDLTSYVGTSTQGGATEYRFTYVEGRSFNSGRTNLTLTLNHQHRQGLYARDRNYLANLFSRYGPNSPVRLANGSLAFEQLTIPAFAGAPGTIVITNPPTAAVNDLGIPGAPGARFATVPSGTSPAQTANLTPASFGATAGKLDPSLGRYGRMVLYEPLDSTSINLQVEHKFIPEKLEGYGEFTLGWNRREANYPETFSIFLSSSDPLNPFRDNVTPGFVGRSVRVYFDTPEFPDANNQQEYQSARAVLGLKGSLSRNWEWSADGVIDYADSTSDVRSSITFLNLLSFSPGPGRDLYPYLSDHSRYPISAADADRYFWFKFHVGNRSVVKEGNVRLMGDVFELPAGPLRTSLLSKYRSFDLTGSRINDGSVDSSTLYLGGPWDNSNLPVVSQRNTWQNAVELAVPVIGKKWHPLPVDAFDLNLSASYESNDTGGRNQSSQRDFSAASKSSNTYVAAAKIQITPDVAFRGSYSEGFYPPDWNDVSDLVSPRTTTSGVLDPRRGNTPSSTPFTWYNGGNPDVRPESAQSVNYGMLFTPRFIQGLSVTVDVWRTEKKDAIIRTNLTQILSRPDDFPSSLTRAPATPAEQALGWLGVITEARTGPLNVSRLKTDGVDIHGKYSRKLGDASELILNGNASFTNHFQTKALPSSSLVEAAGAGGPLRWRGYASATLLRGDYGLTITGRYVGHYYSSTTSPSPAFLSANGLDGGRIPAALLWDLQFTREISYNKSAHGWRGWASGTKWTLGCLNVLDDEPSFVSDIASGFYNRQVDPRQRYVYVQIRKSI